MLSLVGSLGGLIKIKFAADRAVIDNILFRLHYRFTATFFFLSCIFVTAFSFIGDPINCLTSGKWAPSNEHVVNTYCWIHSTYTMPGYNSWDAHPGLRPDTGGERTIHAYYQWVPFVLFLQGILFYAPHWIWKSLEQKKVSVISNGIRGPVMDSPKEKMNFLVDYLLASLRMHIGYALSLLFCECLNLVNVIGNIYFIDKFLGGAFLSYGTRVLDFSQTDQMNRTDPMIEVFPRVTKCIFHKYGPSGTIQRLDAQCILALNILNEKIYIIVWFWLIILACLTAIGLLYRIVLILSPRIRVQVLQGHSQFTHEDGLTAIINRLPFGDFLLLTQLAKNMDVLVFRQILTGLAEKLEIDPALMPLNRKNAEELPEEASGRYDTMPLKPFGMSKRR